MRLTLSIALLLCAAVALAQEEMCTVDGVAPDPASQNKVDKFIQRFQGRPVTKALRKLIMRKLKDKSSGLSKMLGKLAQDPKDESFEEGDLDVSEPANPGLMKMLSKVLGETRTVVGYLWSFGFFAKILNKSPRQADNYNGAIPPCAITQAVMEFQKFNQLPADGKLTKKTRELMALDRCGNPDVKCETDECQADEEAAADEGEEGGLARKKRYALYSRKWKAKEMDLTYFFYNYTNDMPVEKCRFEIEKGLREWTDVSPFSFTEVDNPDDAKFKIFFANRDHFDGHQFDGPWGVLAHAFYPRKGKLHYDDEETFTADISSGVNLYYATTHEMGHGLGLMHSSSYGAVMAPYYPGYKEDIQLSQDDLDGIHKNYGNGKGKVTPLANWRDLSNVYVDNEQETSDGRAPPMEGDGPDNLEFPAPVEETKAEEGPTPEGDGPGNLIVKQMDCIEKIDAAVNSPLEKYAFIFSGGMYVRLEPDERNMPVLSEGYPKAVSDGFPGLPDKIQAGFTDFDNKVSYFFVGGLVYSWSWLEDKVVMKGLEIEQTEFNGLPDDISGVASYRDHVIFINDHNYYLWTPENGLLPGENAWPFQGDNVMHVTGAFNAFLNGYFYTSIDEMPEKYVLFRARDVVNGNPGGAPNPTYSYRKFATDMSLDICAN